MLKVYSILGGAIAQENLLTKQFSPLEIDRGMISVPDRRLTALFHQISFQKHIPRWHGGQLERCGHFSLLDTSIFMCKIAISIFWKLHQIILLLELTIAWRVPFCLFSFPDTKFCSICCDKKCVWSTQSKKRGRLHDSLSFGSGKLQRLCKSTPIFSNAFDPPFVYKVPGFRK